MIARPHAPADPRAEVHRTIVYRPTPGGSYNHEARSAARGDPSE